MVTYDSGIGKAWQDCDIDYVWSEISHVWDKKCGTVIDPSGGYCPFRIAYGYETDKFDLSEGSYKLDECREICVFIVNVNYVRSAFYTQSTLWKDDKLIYSGFIDYIDDPTDYGWEYWTCVGFNTYVGWDSDEVTENGRYILKRNFSIYSDMRSPYHAEARYFDVTNCPVSCSQQFYIEDIDTGTYITGATVKVGGVECEHEYPSIERYIKDNLTEGSWYNVIASKTGYTCPGDICKDTFEACGLAIVLKLKAAITPICSDYTDELSCLAAGCFWYSGTCHDYGPVQCSDYTDALTCVANGCYWWSDGTCHDIPEPTKGIIERISCSATKEAERDYEITAVVTVKNTDTVNHKYRIKMYDSEGTHLDDEPDELDPKPEVAPGGTIDIELTTIGSVPNAKTPEIKCDLYDLEEFPDEFITSDTKACSLVNLGKITKITCSYEKQGEVEYEVEAIVEFDNPDTISHLYKVELLDGKTGDSLDWEPGKAFSGKEVGAGESSAIIVSTYGLGSCSSPLILIKLWETTGELGIAHEQEHDCSAEDEEESFWEIIADFLNMSEDQVKALATLGGGVIALSLLLPVAKNIIGSTSSITRY